MDSLYELLGLQLDANYRPLAGEKNDLDNSIPNEYRRLGEACKKLYKGFKWSKPIPRSDEAFQELINAVRNYRDFDKRLECKRKAFDITDDVDSYSKRIKVKDDPVFSDMPVTLEEIFTGCSKVATIRRCIHDMSGCKRGSREEVVTITIKSGSVSGTQYKFSNIGDVHYNRIPADVVFTLKEKPHDRFARVNCDLHYVASINLKTAITGGNIEIKSICEKNLKINLTQVIEPSTFLVVPNEGLPKLTDGTKRGDLVVRFDIKFPLVIPSINCVLIEEALEDDSDT